MHKTIQYRSLQTSESKIYASGFEGSCLEILKDDLLHSLEITFFTWQQELSLKFQSSFQKLPLPSVYSTLEKVMNIFEIQVADEKQDPICS